MALFSENLRLFRMKSGLKQSEIAKKVGVTPATWSNYEVGKSEPNLDIVEKIAKTLNISLDALMGIEASEKFSDTDSPEKDEAQQVVEELRQIKSRLSASPSSGKSTLSEDEKSKLIRILIELTDEKNANLEYLRNRNQELEEEVKRLKAKGIMNK
jgi:transcriptional regulator with XRE-family HTH domain